MSASKQTVVIANSAPKYSETWMSRMTEMLRPDVSELYFQGDGRELSNSMSQQLVLPSIWNRVPRRIALKAGRKYVNAKVARLIVPRQHQLRLLIHFASNAVYLRKALDELDCDVYVHCHGQDVTWDQRVEAMPFLRVHSRGYAREVLGLSERVTYIANSLETAGRLNDLGVPGEKIRLKYLGVPIPETMPVRNPSGTEGVVVLFLGRLIDCKGPVQTIRAFDLACQRGLKGRLLVAGGGVQRRACEAAVKACREPERVSLLGPVSSSTAAELLRSSHIFTAHNQKSMITGQVEALGVGPLEAMAAAIPVVTGRSGGVCETVLHGETGHLFEPGNIEEHADALLGLARDESRRLAFGAAGFERARCCFSLECERQNLLNILDNEVDSQYAGRLLPVSLEGVVGG